MASAAGAMKAGMTARNEVEKLGFIVVPQY
jgi:hypothetical protein